MNKIFILAIMALAASCTPAKQTEGVDSTAVTADTVLVQSVNPEVEGTVPVDTVK